MKESIYKDIADIVNENKKLKKIIFKATKYIQHLEWIEMSFDMLGKERIRGTTKDFVNDLLDILEGSDKK